MMKECFGKWNSGNPDYCIVCPDEGKCMIATNETTTPELDNSNYCINCLDENSRPIRFGQYISLNDAEHILESMKGTTEETVANICEGSSLLDSFSIADSATVIEEEEATSNVLIPADKDINVCITYDDYHTIIDTTELEGLVATKFEDNTLHLQKRLSYNEHKDFIGYLDPEDANLNEALKVLNDYRNSHYTEPSGTSSHYLAIAINEVLPKFVYLMEIINDIQQNVKWRDSSGEEID